MMQVQICEARRRTFAFEVASSRDPAEKYTVSGTFVDGMMTCTCPGFRFKGSCRHTQLKEVRCGWRSDLGERQEYDHVCPRCGSKTVDTLIGGL